MNHPDGYTEEEKAMLREAAEWFVRVHDDASLEDFAAWQAWLDRSEAHREAFRRIEEAWELAGQLPR
jgi:transmembrane sensor